MKCPLKEAGLSQYLISKPVFPEVPIKRASLVAQMVKNLPAVWDTWVLSLDLEDPLEKGMATHTSILSWRLPGTGEPGGPQTLVSQSVRHDWSD